MATDEALLEAVEAGNSPPTLRLYAWEPPCLSLGVAQPAADVDLVALRRAGWDLVRRPTGGRAILHTDEMTYSIVAGIDDPLVAGGIVPSYRRMSRGLLAALAELGLATRATKGEGHDPGPSGNPVCFENPGAYEITAGERKLIGSAQVRRKRGVLQHGTLPLRGDLGRICRVLSFDSPQARQAASERIRSRAATVESLLGNSPAWSTVAEAFKVGFEQALGIVFEPSQPTDKEREMANALVDERYGREEWTFRV
jgi:lipoate-protein ligase A